MARIFDKTALIAARARARLTLEELGVKTELTAQQINRYEKGHVVPRDTTIVILADALVVKPESLYTEENK